MVIMIWKQNKIQVSRVSNNKAQRSSTVAHITEERKKTDEEKQCKKQELDRAREKTRINIGGYRNRTMRVYFVVVVIFSVTSWLSVFLCHYGYKPAGAQQAPLWGGALKAGLQRIREEEGCIIQIFWKNSQNSRLQGQVINKSYFL